MYVIVRHIITSIEIEWCMKLRKYVDSTKMHKQDRKSGKYVSMSQLGIARFYNLAPIFQSSLLFQCPHAVPSNDHLSLFVPSYHIRGEVHYEVCNDALVFTFIYCLYQSNTSYKGVQCIFFPIWASDDELAVKLVYCYDFQLVESGAWNSTFFSYYIRHNFSQIDLFSMFRTSMNSSDMCQLKYELKISC